MVGSTWMNFIDDIRLQAGAQWGFVEIRIRPYTDMDGSDDITAADCLGTQIDLRFEIQPIPQTTSTFNNPAAQDGAICSGETIDIDLGTNAFQMIGGGVPTLAEYEFEVVQIRYSTDGGATYPVGNAGYPVGLSGGTYSVGDIISSAVAQISETLINNTAAPIYLRYQVMAQLTNDPFCADGPLNIRVVINPNPIPNSFPDPAEVCAGLNIELFGNPNGFPPFSNHTWSGPGAPYLTPTNTQNTVFNHTIPGSYDVYYSVTDGNGCIGSDTITVTVHANPIANITPEPAEACILTDIQLNGNPSGGTMPYTHLWTGMGSPYLNNTMIVDPIFNTNLYGPYEVTYTVTDINGCIGSDVLTINITDSEGPEIDCPAGPIMMNTDLDRCDAVVCFPITTTDDCPFFTPENLADHVFIGTFGGSTYFRSANAMSWEAANAQAAALGGHLVNITSAAEQNFLANNIPTNLASSFWIGLRYSRSLGAYKWTSGAPVVYTNWAFSEPTLLGSHDYVFYWDVNSPAIRGWHDTPAEIANIPVNQRYIIEFSGLPEILTAGLPSGSIFPLGTTMVSYQTTDSAGNQDDCTFAVQVIDNQDPVVTCPQDITIYLEPLECEGYAEYEAIATDNCSVASIDYSFPSGSFFPIGITPVDVTVTDGSGNEANCSFNILVYDYINPNLACKPVNLSLDEFCSTSLDPTIFLTGWQTADPDEILLGCLDNFIIMFLDKNDNVIPVDQLKHHIGKTLRFKVSHTFQSFTCWNEVLIEDKFPPQIDCRDITVNCLANTDNLEIAFASDNCFAEPKLVNETHQVIQCDEDFIGTIMRTYVAVDKYGNQSPDSCTATIYLERSNFGGIVPPVNDTLQCSDNFKKDNKGFNNPDPSVTGVPTFMGVPVYPTSALNMLFCNASIDYEDVIIFDTSCKKKIRRTWKIYEWHCGNLETFFIGLPQMIDIIDNTPPVIPPVNDMLLTTRTKSCSALAQLPQLNITDNCNTVKLVNVNVTNGGLAVGHLSSNGGELELPVGTNEVVYQAIDFCGNASERRFIITVRDDSNPIALCDQYTTVSINTNGYTVVTAKAVDDGSFDECGDVLVQIQRMEDPCGTNYHIRWHDTVAFCCLDANLTRMVTVLVTDEGGNTNMCMVSVKVQEKVNPTIACPDDITISDCTFTFDPNNLDFYFGAATITDNCPANNDLIHDADDARNQCGTGILTRYFEVQSNGISYGSCTQTITFENNDAFDGNDPADLQWPADYTAVNECDVLNLEPEMLPDGFNMPVIVQDACDRVGFTKDDQVFPFTTNGSCFKILRTWTVIDWCQTDIDGNYYQWTHVQEIKVMDNEAPVITSPDTTRVTYSYDANCAGGLIELTASAEDCTPEDELAWEYIIYDAEGDVYETGEGNDASGIYPLGDYLIEFTVEDRCGNLATTSYTFEIISVKSATPICFQGLSTDLVAMDLDTNGVSDTAMSIIHIEMFNNHSYHDCYPNEPLQFSFSPDVNDTVRVFGCADLGLQTITMYVTDINGNQAFCITDLLVTNNDTNYVCPDLLLEGMISGRVVTENNLAIGGVTVSLEGTEIDAQTTNTTGEFAFPTLSLGGSYNVQPEKDGDDLNGVSTLDLVLIQRHILGLEKLPTMYKYLAADVNLDNKINSIDLVELRKLILGTFMELPNNQSWRFMEENFQFLDPNNPLALFIPGNCAIQNLQQNMIANFIGVKVGDVNESAKLDGFGTDDLESRHYFAFTSDNAPVKAGDMVTLAVRSNSNTTLLGWQSQLTLKDGELISVQSEIIPGLADQLVTRDNQVWFSVALGQGKVVRADETVFTITFRAGKDGNIHDFITMENAGLRAEVYTENTQSAKSLKWNWVDVTNDVFAITKHQPNPWKESTMVGFSIPKSDMVSVKVKDQTGRTVYSTTDYYPAGEQEVIITRDAIQTSGMYFVEIKYNKEVQTIKTIMID